MAHYRVSQTSRETLTLQDASGRRHRARPLHDLPPMGAEFHGPHPAPGFAILSDAATRRLWRVIFEQVDCGHEAASPASPRMQAESAGHCSET